MPTARSPNAGRELCEFNEDRGLCFALTPTSVRVGEIAPDDARFCIAQDFIDGG